MEHHEHHMREAMALALKGAGLTSPNPIVGAVVVKDAKTLGRGYHRKAGLAHAEVEALGEAKARAKGADLYVTLEPCCHEGRTPPCVDAIERAGIARVFVGARDPNPRVNGKGVRALRARGIQVVEGVLGKPCRELNVPYNTFMRTGLPFVTAKAALTLDGKIATASGHSRWITNARCREYVHELRALSDAVMVGGATLREDDSMLDVRLQGKHHRSPKAVIVDEALAIPRKARILARPAKDVIFVTTRAAPHARVRWLQKRGHELIICRAVSRGLVDIDHALSELGKRGVLSLLVEGGGRLFASFLKAGHIDRMIACIAPKLVGGAGLDFLPGSFARTMKEAIALKDVRMRTFDDNVVIEGRVKGR